jgi:hypothetical protein
MRSSGSAPLLALAFLVAPLAAPAARAQYPYAAVPPAYPSVSYYPPGYTYYYGQYVPSNAFYYPPGSMRTSYYTPSYANPTYSSGATFYGPSAPTQSIISYYTPVYALPAAPSVTYYYYWSPAPPVIYGPYYYR